MLDRLGLPRIVNPNRNPGRSRAMLTAEICDYLGAPKMIWVKGLKGHDITDDHIDSLARFVGQSGEVVVDQPADPGARTVWATSERRTFEVLRSATNAAGRRLCCLVSRESTTIPPHEDPARFVNVYVNWYVWRKTGVIIPSFDDPSGDRSALELVERLFGSSKVVQLRIDYLAAAGGGVHCATQQQPAVRSGSETP